MARKDPALTKAYQAAWYRTNKEQVDARIKAWREAHPEQARAYRKKYAESHPLTDEARARKATIRTINRLANLQEARWRSSEYQHRRRARQQSAFVEPVVASVVYERDKGLCGICGKKVAMDSFQLDHILPLACGGEHSYRNIQLAHPKCNRSKRNLARIPQQLRLVG